MQKFSVTHRVFLALFILLLNGCGGNGSSGGNPDVQVNELSNSTTSYDETVHINNCGGKANSEQTKSRSFSTNIEGRIDVGVKQVVEGVITAKYSQSRNVSVSQSLVAPAGTDMEFVLRWKEEVHAGNVTANGTTGTYKVNIPIAVEQVSSQDLGCDTSTITVPALIPTLYSTVFRDDFEGSLDRSWQWVRENKQTWSLTSKTGWLEILSSSGHVGSEDGENLLVHKAPSGNFGIETKLKFKPISNFQIAGLLIYKSPADFIQFGRAFCDISPCPGDGFYSDLSVNSTADPKNFAVGAPTTDTVYLRLFREGNNYTTYSSEDGIKWSLTGTHISEMDPSFVGLVVGQNSSTTLQPAQFDYFVIFSLP